MGQSPTRNIATFLFDYMVIKGNRHDRINDLRETKLGSETKLSPKSQVDINLRVGEAVQTCRVE